MTTLQLEANKLQEQKRTNLRNEEIKSNEAQTHRKTYEMQKQEQPFRIVGSAAKAASDVLTPVSKLAGTAIKTL